jgi:Uma2 family endonuclease
MSITTLRIEDKTAKYEPVIEQVSEHGRYVTEEDYWENYYEHPDFNYEWDNGRLEEVGVSDFKNVSLYDWFHKILSIYLETHKMGKLVSLEFGFRLALPRKVSIRKPDIGIVLLDNKRELYDEDHSYKGIYDMCVEVISDLTKRDIDRDTVLKKNEYQVVGVKEYFILDASYKHMTFYRRNKLGYFDTIQPIQGEIIRSQVLEGFQFRISDLIKRPTIEELAQDALYNRFIVPSYKKVIQRAELAEKRAEDEKRRAELAEKRAVDEKRLAETERQRAEDEKRRADMLAAKLRALGISVD